MDYAYAAPVECRIGVRLVNAVIRIGHRFGGAFFAE